VKALKFEAKALPLPKLKDAIGIREVNSL